MKDEIKEINIPESVLIALGDLTNGALNYYKATETVKVKYNTILDYITNLQEENEELKMTNLALADDITKNKIIKQEVLTECCGIPIGEIPMIKIQNDEYKQRIEKATEYTEKFTNGKTSRIDTFENVELVLETILQILKGE